MVPGVGRHNASAGRGQARQMSIVSQPTSGARSTYGHDPSNVLALRSSAPQGQGSTHPTQSEQISSLSGVASEFAAIRAGDYGNCEKFMSVNPDILKEDHKKFLQEALKALKAGDDVYARCCVQQSLLLRDSQPEFTDFPQDCFDQLLDESAVVRKAAEKNFTKRREEVLKRLRETLPTAAVHAATAQGVQSEGVASLNVHGRHAAPPSGLPFSPTAPRKPLHPRARRGQGPRGSSDIFSDAPTNNGELMDESYKVQHSAFFAVGRVFAILWHTNIGHSSQPQYQQYQANNVTSGITHSGRFNVPISSHIQRMVVVNREHGYCWCIPVNTYHGKGVAKRGFNKSDRAAHSIIYMDDEDPFQADDEFDIIKKAIAVNPADQEQKLDRMSRLNFGKVHTVEHNVRVKPVGRVAQQSLPYFEGYWAAKAKESCEKS